MTTTADHKVLIVAADPLLAALVGSVVELSSLRATFPRAGERAEDALGRMKPLLAILIDAVAGEAESDIFLARARKRGVEVLLFGSASRIVMRRGWAEAHGVPIYALPDQVSDLEEALQRLVNGAGKNPRTFERGGKGSD